MNRRVFFPFFLALIAAIVTTSVYGQSSRPVADQIQARNRIAEKALMGVMKPMKSEDIRDTVARTVVSGATGANASIPHISSMMDATLLSGISAELNGYLDRYGVSLKEDKLDPILAHMEKYAAFKAAVYTISDPTPIWAKIIAGQLARGIRWANRDDNPYPNERQRIQAKMQINTVFSFIEDKLKENARKYWMEDRVEKEIAIMVDGFEWRTDSPFEIHGKKLFSKERLDGIIAESLRICDEHINGKESPIRPSFQAAPIDIQLRLQEMRIWNAVHAAARPLIMAYAEGVDRVPSAAEQEETKQLIQQLRK